ncbi:MAG: membrane protein insertion efficiency factor YidD [Saprospiraceae bacterium]|nr:membrane protein insertion efficiency factor YidD [Saprospiraceae bacterium]
MPKLLTKVYKIVFIFIFINIGILSLNAQNIKTDIDLIEQQDFHNYKYDKLKVNFLFSGNKSPIVRYNPATLSLGGLMYIYQKVISVQFSASCLYNPTCSNFSRLLIAEYGIIKGIALSADRLTRCNRLAISSIYLSKIDKHDHKVHESVEIYKLKK